MEFSSLFRKDTDSTRSLNSVGGSKGGTTADATDQTYPKCGKYLLSDLHLNITIESSGEEDETKLEFEWCATNITGTEISVQILFKDPVYISTSSTNSDKLKVQFLPASLAIFKSKAHKQPIKGALRTESKSMPTQVKLGAVTENVKTAGDVLESVSLWATVLNFLLQLVVGGAMANMWTMINSL